MRFETTNIDSLLGRAPPRHTPARSKRYCAVASGSAVKEALAWPRFLSSPPRLRTIRGNPVKCL
jgi:hypothetical protein